MHAAIQRSTRAFASNLSAWRSHALLRIKQRARELRKVRVKRFLGGRLAYETLSLAGIIAGAAACALWQDSRAAGVFALIALFLLASIGRSLHRIAAGMRAEPAAAVYPNTAPADTSDPRNIYISAKAMQRLRPWVEDQSSLTEESAKAYCSVLLDTLAMLHPKLSGRTHAEDKWS